MAVPARLMVVAKGNTKRATSSLTFCFLATNKVTGKVAIELDVAKAVTSAFDAAEINCLGFFLATRTTTKNCQRICRNSPAKKITINMSIPAKLCKRRCCNEASAVAAASNENNPMGVKYINHTTILTKTSLNPIKNSITGVADLPTERQLIAKTILKNTIGMISYFAAAATMFGGNSDNKYEENGTGFKSRGVALAKIKLGATPKPGLNVFNKTRPMATAIDTLTKT